jgi:four helix bundle protein
MNATNRIQDLEDRLIMFSVKTIAISKKMTHDQAGKHLSNQIVRSGTSPALNYGEAKSAESRKDFIHKLKIALKELRETRSALRIIEMSHLYFGKESLQDHIRENTELIAIFISSINTAQKNQSKNLE